MIFRVKHIRRGKVIGSRLAHNLVASNGADYVTGNVFHSFQGTFFPVPDNSKHWRIGLVTAGSFAAGDTMASNGWTEFLGTSVAYRPWGTVDTTVDRTAGDGTYEMVHHQLGTFSITSDATITGAFWTTGIWKGGTVGTLWGGASFVPFDVQNGDSLTVDYTLAVQANDSLGAP